MPIEKNANVMAALALSGLFVVSEFGCIHAFVKTQKLTKYKNVHAPTKEKKKMCEVSKIGHNLSRVFQHLVRSTYLKITHELHDSR